MSAGTVGPFSGVKVIDFTHVLAGPACAYQLALLGADVIKIEKPCSGDTLRSRGGTSSELMSRNMGTNFLAQNANKRSVALDISQERGRDVFLRLANQADVLVENHRAEFMEKLGLGPATLSSTNPRLIYCRMTGFGVSGPRRNDTAYDVNIQAASGLMSMTGTEVTGPLRCGPPILDYATGMAAAFAISAALFQRETSGAGQVLDVSMLDVAMTLMSANITDMIATGAVPKLRGNQADSGLPTAGSFPTASGLLSLGINSDDQFVRFARAVDREDWLADPRLGTGDARKAHPDHVRQAIVAVLSTRTSGDWEEVLRVAGVPCARVNTLLDAICHPQARDRALFHNLGDGLETGQAVHVAQTPFRMSGAPGCGKVVSRPPELGADTREVLGEAGFRPDEVDALIAEGIVAVTAS